MNKKIILGILFACLFTKTNAKILILTHAFNRPDFIEIQRKTFDKFLAEEYDFMVFNDAKDRAIENNIAKTCNRLNIKHVRIPQAIHNQPYLKRWPDEDDFNHPSIRTSNAIQYSLNEYGFNNDDYVLIIDSDCFLVKPFSIRDFMQGYQLAGSLQSRGERIEYLWNGLVFMDFATMPNKTTIDFNCGKVHGVSVDSGGQTHYYIEQNPSAKVKSIDCIHYNSFLCENCRINESLPCKHNLKILKRLKFDSKTINFINAGASNFEFLLNNTFLHYRGGGNWDHKSKVYHDHKTQILNNYINNIIN